MNAGFDVRRAQAELAAVEGRRRLAHAKLQRAAVDVANAELALTLAKERAHYASRCAASHREPFSWIESWPFLVSGLVVACVLLWASAQGWLA